MRDLPPDDASDLTWLLFHQSDVISRRQALELMSEDRQRHLVRSGRWTRPHRGIFIAHTGPIDAVQRRWIGSLAAGGGRAPATFAGATALAIHGLRGYESAQVYVYLPHRMRATSVPHYVVVHRVDLAPADRSPGLTPCTSRARSAIDAARWAGSDDRARAIITATFQQRLVDGVDMTDTLARMPRVHRRDLIAATIRDAAGGTKSISEQDFLRLCRRGALPIPARQSAVVDAAGRRRYRDVHFTEWGVHVEIDGGQHIEIRHWWADMRRQNDLAIHGDRILRFPAWAVRNCPDAVIAQIRAPLWSAGWRP